MQQLNDRYIHLRTKALFAAIVIGLLVLSGCTSTSITGKNFNQWTRTQLVPGKTTATQALSLLGAPERIETVSVGGATHQIARYTRKGTEAYPIVGYKTAIMRKYLYVDMKDNVVAGYLYSSSFPKDSCDFNVNDVSKVVSGRSRKSDVQYWLGAPHGKMQVPSAMALQMPDGAEAATEKWSYRGYIPVPDKKEPAEKTMDLYFDSTGIVIKKEVHIPVTPALEGTNLGFLRFEDALPVGDAGGYDSIKVGDTLMIFPFTIQRNNEWKVSGDMYPATQAFVSKYVEFALARKFVLATPDSGSTFAPLISHYALDLLHELDSARGTPLSWGGLLPPGASNPHTYFYFPFAVERESKNQMTARFYVLIANHLGEIMFARSMKYDPAKWSSNIEVFKREINDRLPLAE